MKKNLILALFFIIPTIINAKDGLIDRYAENAHNAAYNILRIIPTPELQFIANLFAQSMVSVGMLASTYPLYKEFKKAIQNLRQNKKTDYISLVKKIGIRIIAMILIFPLTSGITMHAKDLMLHHYK